MSTVIDYAGRTVDLLAFQGVFPARPGQEQLLSQQLVGRTNGGLLAAGIEKLVQKVLLVLLLIRGTKTYSPGDGTDFIADARAGVWRTVADVQQSFLSARLDVSRQLRAVETAADPDDERFGDLTLDGIVLNGDSVTLRCTVVSLAGTSYKFLTPIAVAVR